MTAYASIQVGVQAGEHPSRVFEEWLYLQRRCDQERTKASFCANDLVADVHRKLAQLYQARAEGLAGEGKSIPSSSLAGVGEDTAQLMDVSSLNISQSRSGF